MKINLAQHIVELLLEQGVVTVPELGEFSLEKKELKSIGFTSNHNVEDHLLSDHLSNRFGLSKEKSSAFISKFTANILQGLLQDEKVEIAYLGLLEKQGSGELVFTENPTTVAKLNKWLVPTTVKEVSEEVKPKAEKLEVNKPEVEKPESESSVAKKKEDVEAETFTSVSKEKEPQVNYSEEGIVKDNTKVAPIPMVDSNPQKINEEETKAWAWMEGLISVILIGLVGLLVYNLIYAKQGDSTVAPIAEKSTTELNEGSLNDEFGVSDELEDNQDTGISNNPESKAEETSKVVKDDVGKINEQENENADFVETQVEENEIDNELIDDQLEKNANDQSEAVSEEGQTQNAEIIAAANPEDECVIILGSFTGQSNIDRVSNNIKSKGYRLYTESHGPYTRVGLTKMCIEIESDYVGKLKEIRQEFKVNGAWYLKPELNVN